MLEHEPELYRNESKFGSIPDIPVGTTWRNRQVISDTLSRNLLTTAGVVLGMNVQRPGFTHLPKRGYPGDEMGLIPS